MKLLNRQQFLQLQPPVVFAYWSDYWIEFSNNLYVMEEVRETDFITQDLLSETWFQYEDIVWSGWTANIESFEQDLKNGESLELDLDCCWRDWMFEQDQKFLVYENKDIDNLINKLKEAKE